MNEFNLISKKNALSLRSNDVVFWSKHHSLEEGLTNDGTRTAVNVVTWHVTETPDYYSMVSVLDKEDEYAYCPFTTKTVKDYATGEIITAEVYDLPKLWCFYPDYKATNLLKSNF